MLKFTLKDHLSEKEIKMFEQLGFRKELETRVSITPMQLYNFAVVKAFVDQQSGKAVESLRKTFRALEIGLSRMTKEFDELITLD